MDQLDNNFKGIAWTKMKVPTTKVMRTEADQMEELITDTNKKLEVVEEQKELKPKKQKLIPKKKTAEQKKSKATKKKSK